jgi:arginase
VNRDRHWTVLGVPIDSVAAPSGSPAFGTEAAPSALRAHGVVSRLGAVDAGDLDVRIVGPGRDPVSGLVGWPSLGACTVGIRDGLRSVLEQGNRPLVLGGCCALVMGATAAARDVFGSVGVVNVDGHLDLYDHRSSPTGEAADLPIAALLGHGWSGLLETIAPVPVVDGRDVIVLGARDPDEAADLGGLPAELGVTVCGVEAVLADPAGIAAQTTARLDESGRPFWMHIDVDVLDEIAFPATDYLMPGGLSLEQLADLLTPLGHDPRLVGASIGCYNPSKDPGGAYGEALTRVIVGAFGETGSD